MQKRWPLHPKPYSNETLERYVRRLAECYDARYEHFCRRALDIPADDSQARRFHEPTPELLRQLSDGIGIPVGQLEQMTLPRIFKRLVEELGKFAETPEGRAALENFANRRLSQNS
jgi:hypothetical protein